ncbi:hypothetical protein ACA910_008724 [Epithemia clementina (nom. ined.)]
MHKPVSLWGGKPPSNQDLEFWYKTESQDTNAQPHNVSEQEGLSEDKKFIPKMESKFADAATPAKPSKATTLPAMHFPLLMVLKDRGVENSDAEFWSAASFNIEELQNAQLAFHQELYNQSTIVHQQTSIMTALANKINVLSGLVGTPNPYIESPSIWHAITRLHDGLQGLTTQLGIMVRKIGSQGQVGSDGCLVQAELQDMQWHLELMEATVSCLQGDTRHYADLASLADRRARELEQALERNLDWIIVKNSQHKLSVHLHKMEPLLM